jgi:hypothetical protein
MSKLALIPALLACALAANAQSTAPVTKGEMSRVMAKVEPVAALMFGIKIPAREITSSKSPVTRVEFIAELDRLFNLAKPKFVYTPRALPFDQKIIDDRNSPASAKILTKFAKWGAIGPVAPIVTGSDAGLNPREFGDTLAYFVLRLSALTHQPVAGQTPDLMREGVPANNVRKDDGVS